MDVRLLVFGIYKICRNFNRFQEYKKQAINEKYQWFENVPLRYCTHHIINSLQMCVFRCIRVDLARVVVVAVVCVLLCSDARSCWDLDFHNLTADRPTEAVVRIPSVFAAEDHGS